jgi:RNA polymerase sigma-70 factor (ECF subfamily)
MATDAETELIRTLHAEHATALWAFALRLTDGDRGRAEDVVQETLLRAWRHPDAFDDTRPARAWLLTVARRVVIDDWRARRARPESPTDRLPEVGVPDETDDIVRSWLVSDALKTLSPAHRDVVHCCYYSGQTVNETAAQLGIPPGTVKSRLHYGLRSLRLALEEMGVTE